MEYTNFAYDVQYLPWQVPSQSWQEVPSAQMWQQHTSGILDSDTMYFDEPVQDFSYFPNAIDSDSYQPGDLFRQSASLGPMDFMPSTVPAASSPRAFAAAEVAFVGPAVKNSPKKPYPKTCGARAGVSDLDTGSDCSTADTSSRKGSPAIEPLRLRADLVPGKEGVAGDADAVDAAVARAVACALADPPAAAMAMASFPKQLAATPTKNAEIADFPSAGSAAHQFRQCKPCAFFHTKGCESGAECKFCHICEPGEKQRRQKEKRNAIGLARKYKRFAKVANESCGVYNNSSETTDTFRPSSLNTEGCGAVVTHL